MRTIKEILDKLGEAQQNASRNFLQRIVSTIEKAILKRLTSFLDKTDISDGILSNNAANEELLISIGNEVEDSFLESGIEEATKAYYKDFDLVEKLTKELTRRTITDATSQDITELFRETKIFKTKQIDTLTKALLQKASFSSQITDTYRDILFEGIVFEKSIDDIKAELRAKILSTDATNSKLYRYVSQVSRDTISQYEGILQDTVRARFDLDGFAWTGSTKATSRSNCVNLKCASGHPKFTGKFDRFKLPNIRGYRVADIPEIIALMKTGDTSGLNFDITPENFAKLRGGHGCEDSIIFFRITDDDLSVSSGLNSALKG